MYHGQEEVNRMRRRMRSLNLPVPFAANQPSGIQGQAQNSTFGSVHPNGHYFDPSFNSYFGVPIKGAASTDFNRGTLPKNFAQPLTCFYWHTYGQCTKSSDDCLYAHYETGVVASAPVTLGGSKGPVAGRNAMQHVQSLAERETQLKDWESMLITKEMELNGKLASSRGLDGVEATVVGIYDVIGSTKAAVEDAHATLNHHREQIAAVASYTTDANDPTAIAGALNALETAVGDVAAISEHIMVLEKEAEEKIGKAPGMKENVRIYLDAHG